MNIKHIILLTVLIITIGHARAQQETISSYWYQMDCSEDGFTRDIMSDTRAFIKQTQRQDTSEGSDCMVAQRFQHFWQNRLNQTDMENIVGFQAADISLGEFYRTKNEYLNCFPPFDQEWKYIGRDSAETHCMGIVFSLAVDTTDPGLQTIYAGTNASGLWKTIDGGMHWFNITDIIGIPGMGVNDVVISPYDPDVIYMCTGVTTYLRGYGVGIWKSEDAGNTWERIWGEGTSSELARKVLIHPDEPDILFAFINEKVYRTSNAGEDWELVFEEIHQPFSWKTRRILDAEFKPGSGDTLYLISEGTQKYQGDSIVDYHPELWLSYNAMAEAPEWRRIDDTIHWEYTKRGALAVSPAEPDFLYCSFTNNEESRYYLYRYSNATGNWYQKADTTTEDLFQGVDEWRNDLLVASYDTGIFYVGGFYITKITGDSMIQTGSFHDESFHVDVRDMQIIENRTSGQENSADILFVGNDGGVSKTGDGASTWASINGKGLRITQYYDMAASEKKAGLFAGGTQDNGIIIHNPDWENKWNVHMISDNYTTLISNTDPDMIYSLMYGYFPGLFASFDGGQTASQVAGYPADEYVTMGWPLVFDPHHDGTLYTGLREVYRSDDDGQTWEQISAFTLPPHMIDSGQKVEDLRIYRADSRIMYMAFASPTYAGAGKKLFKTLNGGQSWMDVSGQLNFLNYFGITSIEIHPRDHNKVWITLGGFSYTGDTKVIYTDDSFNTYQDVSEGLPNLPVNCIKIIDNPLNELYLCNDAAVFYRNDTMDQWVKYGAGMPVCIVSDLEIDQPNNKIRISTFGRGLWEIDGMNPVYSIPEEEIVEFTLFPNPASQEINIRSGMLDSGFRIRVYDIFGKLRDEIPVPPQQNEISVSVTTYPAGVYLMTIKDEKGILGKKKFVVSR